MKWTRNYPLREGVYWFRANKADAAEPVEVKLLAGRLQAQPSHLPEPAKVNLIAGEWSDEQAAPSTAN